ncbi:MAG: tRNA-dihydrouridine synthase [Phycisphaerae bacterium]
MSEPIENPVSPSGGPDSHRQPEPGPAEAALVRPVRIGPLRLANNLVLAPMHKRTHLAFRLLCRREGAALAHTEMATPQELLGREGPRKAENLLATCPQDRPLGVQVAPRDAGPLADAVRLVAERGTADLVDLNFACPSRRIAGRSGRGAALLRRPREAVRLVAAAVAASDLPVTLKLRLGYTGSEEDRAMALDVAHGAVDAGAAAVTVHGRTARQGYRPSADWDTIAAWAASLPVPVFGSGDLWTPEAVLAMLRQTGCAGASLARGAFGAPWIFRQTRRLAETGRYEAVSREERGRTFLEHYDRLVEQYGEETALKFIRQIGRVYARAFPGAPETRAAIQDARTGAALRRAVETGFGLAAGS